MKIVTVIPLKKGIFRDDLTYFTVKDAPVGSIVTVPIRSSKILGLVISQEDVSDAKINIKEMSFNLKKIIEVKKHSIFLKEYLESILQISKYFIIKKNNAAASLIPTILREKYDQLAKFYNNDTAPEKTENSTRSEKLLLQAPIEDRILAYKTLIRGSFADKKSVFVVLPNERDIQTLNVALSKGIDQFTFVFHGGLSQKKVIEQIEKVSSIKHPVLILGTAPFLSIPRQDLHTIVLEHESASGYKTITKPHLDLRVFVELFASKINAQFVLSDTLLRYETIARCDIDDFVPLHPLSYRVNFDGEIIIENPKENVEDKEETRHRRKTKSPDFKILSDNSIKEIKRAITKKKNVFIFTLRKGLATQTVCKDCKEIKACEKCSSPVVLYLSSGGKRRMFVCNRCQESIDGKSLCDKCGSWNLIPLGIGTDTVTEEVRKIFPKEKILKLDKESAKSKSGATKIITEFEKSEGSILIGTEMAFFYMKNKVPLSIVASFDSLWSIPNFKMSEKVLQLIISIISKTSDKFIIQTKNENDPAIKAIEQENLLSFVREELEDRESLHYPPYKRFVKITHLGDKEETTKARESLKEVFKDYSPEIFSGFIAKQKGKYVTNALMKLNPLKWSYSELSIGASIDENLFKKLSSLPPKFEVSVDPEDLL